MSKQLVRVRTPRTGRLKVLAVLAVLVFLAVRWPHESAAFVQHVTTSLQAFGSAVQSGGGRP